MEQSPEPYNWRDEAACKDSDPDLFFPLGTGGIHSPQIEAAKAICNMCDVKKECLQFALETNQDHGIWGGTDERERRRIRRRWLAQKRGEAS